MAKFEETGKIWFNGKFVEWKDATIHILSHVVHYGSSVFEGLRCYNTPKGPTVFRLQDHTRRLFDSAKIYRLDIPFTQEEINQAVLDTLKENNQKEAYIRPIALRGYHSLGVDPRKCPVQIAIATWKWGQYLGDEALEKGVDVRVSSWVRMAPNSFPALAKAGGHYLNSQLIKLEALTDGYVEGIALDVNGYVSEGSGENLFLIYNGRLCTPPLGASVLPGITRASVIKLARDMGIKMVEQLIPREALYIADELFLTGSAAEITPIRSVDRINVGSGKRGPITEMLQKRFFDVINGEIEDRYNWLTYVH